MVSINTVDLMVLKGFMEEAERRTPVIDGRLPLERGPRGDPPFGRRARTRKRGHKPMAPRAECATMPPGWQGRRPSARDEVRVRDDWRHRRRASRRVEHS